MMKAATIKNFQPAVIDNPKISFVQFKTEWSGAWKIIEPVCIDLANTYGDQIDFFTVDVEAEKKLEEQFGVGDVPTILIFKSGEIIGHSIGLTSRTELICKINAALEAAHENVSTLSKPS